MSKLSCEKFRSNDVCISLITRKNAIDIDIEFEQIALESTQSSSSVTNVTITNGTRYLVPGAYTGGVTNSLSHFTTFGYRLFFKDGFLKCVKREASQSSMVSNYNYVTVNGVTHNVVPKNKIREAFYHPAAIWDSIKDEACRKQIQNHVIAFALRRGIEVPQHFIQGGTRDFNQDGEQYKDHGQYGYNFAALDWLAYPLIREINSPAVCRNLVHAERDLIAPNFNPMNFKQLINHYYGHSTNKMLEEIWKVIAIGNETKKTIFQNTPGVGPDFVNNWLDFQDHHKDVLEINSEYAIQTGDKRIQAMAFTVGPAIFKAMGFDYFYQAVSKLGRVTSNSTYQGIPFAGNRSSQIEFNLATLLRSVSPKKLLNALFDEEGVAVLHHLHDAASMLRDYEDPEKIPKTLKFQYPTGLVVDFKFKTMKELHDKISTQYTIIKTEASRKEIPVAPIYQLLHGRERNGLRLVVPDNTSILAVWGKLLSICIASYGDNAAKGNTLLLGVEKNDQIKYCIEFKALAVARIAGALYGLIKEGHLSEPMAEPEYIREAYPRLTEKHVGVMPTDVPEEEGIYYMPSIVQFRSERNGNPDNEDRIVVENMLCEWVKENLEFLSTLKGIFEEKSDGSLNMDMLRDAVNRAADQGIQQNQLIMNPHDYAAYAAQLDARQAFRMNGDGRVPLVYGGIDVIADRNVPRNRIVVQQQEPPRAIHYAVPRVRIEDWID